MAKRGTKPKPDGEKVIAGTFRHDRTHPAVTPTLHGAVTVPSWLSPLGKAAWLHRVSIYQRRGQSIVGCEDALATYCDLYAQIIEGRKVGKPAPVSVYTAFRIFASEFHDTPASQLGNRAAKPETENPFIKNRRA